MSFGKKWNDLYYGHVWKCESAAVFSFESKPHLNNLKMYGVWMDGMEVFWRGGGGIFFGMGGVLMMMVRLDTYFRFGGVSDAMQCVG